MQITEASLIIIFVACVAVVVIYMMFKTKYKHKNLKIEELEKLKKSLSTRVTMLEEKLNERNASSSKTSFVMEQIKKIESLEHEILKLRHRIEDVKSIAQNAMKVKHDFLVNIKSEVRTPMSSILSYTNVLKEITKDKAQLTVVDNISREGEKFLHFIDEVIELSKIETGLFTIYESAVNSRIIFESIIHKYQEQAHKKNLTLSLNIDGKLPDSIIIDSLKVQDLLTNLVENAIEFTENGIVKVDVVVDGLNSAKNVLDLSILVEDSGIGMDKKTQKEIFEIFEFQENVDDSTFSDIGLGLSVDKKIAKLMNGDLTCTSELGKGSTFKFSLHDVEIALGSDEHDIDEEDIDFSMIKADAKIVVIDEVADIRESIVNYFIQSSAQLFLYENLRDSIETLKTQKIDLILIDVDILNVDEGAVSKVLKKMSDAPVVVLTQTQLKGMVICEDGVKPIAYLKKPISKLELFKVSLKALNSQNVLNKP